MAELTGYERVMRTFKREPVDTMPFFSGYGMVLLPAIKKLGYKFPQIHTSAEKIARSGVESARMFNLDSVGIPYDMCAESEALGNKISLYEGSDEILYPTIPSKKWETLDQVNITQEDIDTIMTRGRMANIPQAIKMAKELAPEKAVGAWQLGPFTQCGQTIELDKVLKGVFKQKKLIEDILSSCFTIRGWGIALISALIGLTFQAQLWEIAALAIIATFLIAFVDGYHSWLYARILRHAQNVENVLGLYYASLARGDDDPDARRDYEVAIQAHHFGRFADVPRFQLSAMREARPRMIIVTLYVTLLACALVSGALVFHFNKNPTTKFECTAVPGAANVYVCKPK